MKKLVIFFALLFFLLTGQRVTATSPIQLPAKSAMAIEVRTGKILYEKQADQLLPIGNLTRLMTLYLTYQAIKSGQTSLEETVTVSDEAYALSYNPEVAYLSFAKKSYTVKELISASLMAGSAPATLALAQHVSGSEDQAIKDMKQLLENWKLDKGVLVNSTGINPSLLSDHETDQQENTLSARQLATIGYRLVRDFPEVLEISELSTTSFGGSAIYSYNYLLSGMPYERPDAYGLLTGSSDHGASLIAMSYENQMQVMLVMIDVDGADEDPDKRFTAANDFFDQIGNRFRLQQALAGNSHFKNQKAPVLDGTADRVSALTQDDFYVVTPVNQTNDLKLQAEFPEKTNYAPITEGQAVGKVVFDDQNLIGQGYLGDLPSVTLVAETAVDRTHLLQIMWNHFVTYVTENL